MSAKRDAAEISLAAGSPYLTPADRDFNAELAAFFENCGLSTIDKIQSFPVFARRQDLTKFLCRYEIFKQVLDVHGSVIELGVFLGAGLLSFAKLSAILEPVNNSRRFFGFDTFTGFPGVTKSDVSRELGGRHVKTGQSDTAGVDGLKFAGEAARLFDRNRFLPQIPKVELIKGDACVTVPKFLKEHPELVLALLYIDINLYEPVKKNLPALWERVPKGGIVVFDELNAPQFPGETLAVAETLGIGNLRLKRGPMSTYVSYAVKE